MQHPKKKTNRWYILIVFYTFLFNFYLDIELKLKAVPIYFQCSGCCSCNWSQKWHWSGDWDKRLNRCRITEIVSPVTRHLWLCGTFLPLLLPQSLSLLLHGWQCYIPPRSARRHFNFYPRNHRHLQPDSQNCCKDTESFWHVPRRDFHNMCRGMGVFIQKGVNN